MGWDADHYVNIGERGKKGATCHKCGKDEKHVDWQLGVIGKDSRR